MANQPSGNNEQNEAQTKPDPKSPTSGTVKGKNNDTPISSDGAKKSGTEADITEPSGLSRRFLRDIEVSDWITAISTVAIAILTAFYVSSSREQLRTMQGQLDEMKRSGQTATDQTWRAIDNMNWMAKEMHRSVEESQSSIESSRKQSEAAIRAAQEQNRPWIEVVNIEARNNPDNGFSLNFATTPPIPRVVSQAYFYGSLTIRNVGQSVAANTTIAYELVLGKHGRDVLRVQHGFCKSFLGGAVEPLNPGVLIFPEKPYTTDIGDAATVWQENVFHDEAANPVIIASLIGCVNYQSTFSANLYQSGFVFNIAHTNDNGPDYESFQILKGMPMDALRLIRIGAADYAR